MESEPITVLCLLCAMSKRVKHKRDECKDNVSRQAEKMIDASVKRFKQADIGDNVLVPVPNVNRGRSDFRNIKGIMTAAKGNGCYIIGAKHGTLKQIYSRNQFIPTMDSLARLDEVLPNKVCLREGARKSQLKVARVTRDISAKKQYVDNDRLCGRNGRLCNSKCHSHLMCTNK